ncbi:hypothetical protein [Nocardioides sp. CFH 31398]|nr:hypothetical protein [Nocardioides sp. CFH 31398]MCH1865729.1 hypothetical protein [Nocardioides sp. CFH 31398]
MSAGVVPGVLAAVVGSWGVIVALIGLAAVLTVIGLVSMARSRRTGGPR